MMTQAFYTGISGIRSDQYAIDIVSDNIANISSVGFRGAEYEFASLFEESINTASSSAYNSVGIGSRLQATGLKEGSGVLTLTDKSTDLAIVGDGWFGIQGPDKPVYTRDGSFSFDTNNDLVSLDGFHVLGTMGGNIAGDVLTAKVSEIALGEVGTQVKLSFPKSLTFPTQASTVAKFRGNLSIEDETRTMGATVIDAQGNRNNLKLTFTQSIPQVLPGTQWDITASAETADGATVYDTKTGKVEFGPSGELLSNTLTTIDNNGVSVAVDLQNGFDGVVALSNNSIADSSEVNGKIGGDLAGYSINQNAEVIATFTNGEQSSVGQIAVYHFGNDQGLARLNGSKFQESENSGAPIFYKDTNNQNVLGTDVANFRLEGSNIDLTYGLTELIILQRSYDANSKSITTADQMMQKALSMDA